MILFIVELVAHARRFGFLYQTIIRAMFIYVMYLLNYIQF